MMGEREVYRWLFFLALLVIAAAAGVLLFKLHRRRCTHCRRITRPGRFTLEGSPEARLCAPCRQMWEQQRTALADEMTFEEWTQKYGADAVARMHAESLENSNRFVGQPASTTYTYVQDPPPPPRWNQSPSSETPAPPSSPPAQCDICGVPFKRKYSAFKSQFYGIQFVCPHCRRALKRKKYDAADSYVVQPPHERMGFIYEVHCSEPDGSKVIHNIWANMPRQAEAMAKDQGWKVLYVLVSKSGAKAEFVPLRNRARYVPF